MPLGNRQTVPEMSIVPKALTKDSNRSKPGSMRQVLVSGWLLVIAFGLSGCATRTLWENHAFDGFNEPARPANLRVFRTHDDWLVRYDEVNENTDRIKQRAYYLEPNRSAINDHKRPHFVG